MSGHNILTYDQLLAENMRLSAIIINLKKEKEEFDKCTARVYSPNKSYKDLEEKLANSEEQRKKDIDELWTTRIIPLQKKTEEQDIKLNNAFKSDLNNLQRIKDLERVIEKQNVVINLAAGYISSTPQFSNEHPINVKKWLMGGME